MNALDAGLLCTLLLIGTVDVYKRQAKHCRRS